MSDAPTVEGSSDELTVHLRYPLGLEHTPAGAYTGAAGGAACGDLVRISLALDDSGATIADAGFAAGGCASIRAAGSAVVALVRGRDLLDAARVGEHEISQELGGLSPAGAHAAELAADALHRALGGALRGAGELPAAPGREYVWIRGNWHWNGAAWVWHAGHYDRVRVGFHWVHAHYEQRGPNFIYVPGHWAR